MAYHEHAFCPIQEFDAWKSERLYEHQLDEKELYVALFALHGAEQNQRREAAKIPATVLAAERISTSGQYVVSLVILNADSHPPVRTKLRSLDGLLVDHDQSLQIIDLSSPDDSKFAIKQGYLKRHEKDRGTEGHAVNTAVYLPYSELVVA